MADKPVTPERILQFWFGYAPPLMLEAAVHIKLFDALDSGPKTSQQVAAATGASVRGVRILMNALAALEFLKKTGDTYSLTPETSAFLVTTKPGFMGGMFRHTSRQILPNWMKLTEAVKTGKPAVAVNQESTGAEFFQQFVEDLFAAGYASAKVLADHLNVAAATTPVKVLDIAAGSGVWSIALAEKSNQVRVTVVDWPGVIPVCQKVTARHGVADRYSYIPGDLLAIDYGTGYQVATLGHILHSEGPERSRKLLKKVFDALAPGGTIAISEMVPNDDRTGPPHALIFAVNMLVHTETGDTFTFGEMSDWLTAAGFVNPWKLEVPAPSPLILATRPK
ncbi:MAG: methyltransferase dimerization domain-containing protein [Gemmataceae bacterium]